MQINKLKEKQRTKQIKKSKQIKNDKIVTFGKAHIICHALQKHIWQIKTLLSLGKIFGLDFLSKRFIFILYLKTSYDFILTTYILR